MPIEEQIWTDNTACQSLGKRATAPHKVLMQICDGYVRSLVCEIDVCHDCMMPAAVYSESDQDRIDRFRIQRMSVQHQLSCTVLWEV